MNDKNNIYILISIIGIFFYIMFNYLYKFEPNFLYKLGIFSSLLLWTISFSGYFIGSNLNEIGDEK